jgi:alpha-galactosidase
MNGNPAGSRGAILARIAVCGLLGLGPAAHSASLTVRNSRQSVQLDRKDGSWTLRDSGLSAPLIRSQVGAQVNERWIFCSDYPTHRVSRSSFRDVLGAGVQAAMLCTGLRNQPSLTYTIRLYEYLPEGSISVAVENTTHSPVNVQAIRPVDATGEDAIHTGPDESSDRILSDSFSEDWPPLRIYSYNEAADGLFLGVGSQLIYDRDSHTALFFGALTSNRFLSILRWRVSGNRPGYTVDSTGTTPIQATDEESGLRGGPVKDLIQLSLPLAPGAHMDSERLMFSTGPDYFSVLEDYGEAIRTLHHPRPDSGPIMGWWSWTAYYAGITAGAASTNAQWLAQHLRALGFDFFHIDLGYAYARGEYTTPNASQFPHGLRPLSHQICHLGLRQGFWTAPFEVSDRSWVYQHHKDWLVHNAEGQPINIGVGTEAGREVLYVLDATNPGAQQYLRYTYRTLTQKWGAQYIKLDFMDNTAIEGYYYRPHTTALEAQRIGLQVIRDAVGPHVLLDKDGSPMLNTVGLINEGRLSQDTGHSFLRTKEAAPGIAARFYMDHNFFLSDPDAFTVSKQTMEDGPIKAPLTLHEAQASITLAALAGGMYEIGDDLPTLGSETARLALVRNPVLVQMIRLSKPAIAVDLLTYRRQDEQPSIFVLHEDRRQTLLAVFNWTEQQRSHTLSLGELSLPVGDRYSVADVFNPNAKLSFENGQLKIDNQVRHSVRLLKVIDDAVPAQAPAVTLSVPSAALREQALRFAASARPGVPALQWTWDFGDGVTARGPEVQHTYTQMGTYHLRLTVSGIDGIPFRGEQTVTVSGKIHTAPPRRYLSKAAKSDDN